MQFTELLLAALDLELAGGKLLIQRGNTHHQAGETQLVDSPGGIDLVQGFAFGIDQHTVAHLDGVGAAIGLLPVEGQVLVRSLRAIEAHAHVIQQQTGAHGRDHVRA
ncbi:hypothetical protein D3C81_1717130 [compost metagenome]